MLTNDALFNMLHTHKQKLGTTCGACRKCNARGTLICRTRYT